MCDQILSGGNHSCTVFSGAFMHGSSGCPERHRAHLQWVYIHRKHVCAESMYSLSKFRCLLKDLVKQSRN